MARKLLWVSPFSLHDTSSGAAVQCRSMLESLAKYGIEIKVLGTFIFDSPRGATAYFPNLQEIITKQGNQPLYFKDENSGIDYYYTICKSTLMEQFSYNESWEFFQYFSMFCNSFRPDITMGYGTGVSGIAIHAEAKRRGIPFVYPLCNANHPYYTFDDCALLITESKATSELYAMRDRMNVLPTGIFISEDKITKERDPKYVTMVNPHPSKGFSIFAKLAEIAQKELPNVKFLAVDGRGSFAESLGALHLPNSEKKPYTPAMFKNVDVASHTGNMKEVYKITQVLIAPSLAYESWGRVVSEAVLNKIPALVSANNGGGLQEAMAGMGYALEAPKECLQDHLRIPTNAEIRPWLNALKQALKKDFSKEFKKAQQELNIETSTQRLLEILEPLFAKKAGQNPQIILNGILRMEHNGSFK